MIHCRLETEAVSIRLRLVCFAIISILWPYVQTNLCSQIVSNEQMSKHSPKKCTSVLSNHLFVVNGPSIFIVYLSSSVPFNFTKDN